MVLPTVCALIMGAAAWGVYRGIIFVFPALLHHGRIGMAFVVLPSVAAAIAVYGVLLIRLKAVDEEELKEMPMGTRLVGLCKKAKLL